MYVGIDGVYTHTAMYAKDPACPCCSPGVLLAVDATATLRSAIAKLQTSFPDLFSVPSSVTAIGNYAEPRLYARGIFEADTAPNLDKTLNELLGIPGTHRLLVSDPRQPVSVRVRLNIKPT